jgi:hypothetical protein
MSVNVFPCYPFAESFEEEVFNRLASELNENIGIAHNVLRPNIRVNYIPKEIDLVVMIRNNIVLAEIKNYYKSPIIDDVTMTAPHGDEINPIIEMKKYGQRLKSEVCDEKIYTIPCGIFKTIDTNKISKKMAKVML